MGAAIGAQMVCKWRESGENRFVRAAHWAIPDGCARPGPRGAVAVRGASRVVPTGRFRAERSGDAVRGEAVKYRREIDGLRAVAVIPVMIFHAMPSVLSGGYLGVDVFFVISGYLITSIILAELEGGRFSVLRFYERRVRRILPALFVVMAVCVPFAWAWMAPREFSGFARALEAVPLFVSNFLFRAQIGYFHPEAELKPLLHTWSLAVEEQFYVVYPIMLALVWKVSRRLVVPFLVLGLLVSLGAAEWGAYHKARANFFLAPGRGWELLAGALCAFALQRWSPRKGATVLPALGLAMVLVSMFLFDGLSPSPGLITVLPVSGVVLFILFARPETSAGKLLSLGPVVGIGLISYSAYLWHQPLFAFARLRMYEAPTAAVYGLLGLASLALAWLSWRLVEAPFRARAGRPGLLTRPALFAGAAVVSLLFVGIGLSQRAGLVQPRTQASVAPVQELMQGFIAERNALSPERCQVWPVYEWRSQWHDCDPYARNARPTGRRPVPIAVMGDSLSTDLATGLRRLGYEPVQAVGAGCKIVPSNMSPACREFFDHVLASPSLVSSVREIWITNRTLPDEWNEALLGETLAYWSRGGWRVVLFTPRPEYPGRNQLLYKEAMFGGPVSPRLKRAFSAAAPGAPFLPALAARFGAAVVNSDAAFCALAPGCSYRTSAGDYLTLDYGHLTNLGAELFLREVLDNQLCAAPGSGRGRIAGIDATTLLCKMR